MRPFSKKLLIDIPVYCAIAIGSVALLAQSEILDITELNDADATTLLEDTKKFHSIGIGIAFSIAECSGKEICEPRVVEDEIGRLIEVLDKRIEDVSFRQENSGEELTTVITAYVDIKDKYTDYLERLNKIVKYALPQESFIEQDALVEDEFNIFDDVEDELDLDLRDDEDDEDT